MKYCPYCGSSCTDEFVFCNKCGKKLPEEIKESTDIAEKPVLKLDIIPEESAIESEKTEAELETESAPEPEAESAPEAELTEEERKKKESDEFWARFYGRPIKDNGTTKEIAADKEPEKKLQEQVQVNDGGKESSEAEQGNSMPVEEEPQGTNRLKTWSKLVISINCIVFIFMLFVYFRYGILYYMTKVESFFNAFIRTAPGIIFGIVALVNASKAHNNFFTERERKKYRRISIGFDIAAAVCCVIWLMVLYPFFMVLCVN